MAVRERPTFSAIRDRGRRVHGFWQRITGGFELEQLWDQFLSEARASYGLFSHDVDWDGIDREPKKWKKPFRIGWALFLAMLMKLTPARRVLLLLAIILVLVPTDVRVGSSTTNISLSWIGAVLLFLLLVLELADRVTMKRDLEIAREIQQWLVPAPPRQIPSPAIATTLFSGPSVAKCPARTRPRW